VKDICDKIQWDKIPIGWKIIIIHAKERELKIAPLLFAMMVLEMRIYFCVTEANISKTIFPYFPQQTMSLDEADLSKRLLLIASDNQESLRSLSVMIGIDFSSWNIYQTYMSTLYTFQFIDDLFGTNGLYLRSHKFFESSLVALASNQNPPLSLIGRPKGEPDECNELWYHHCGGFEGLRQKGWTLATIGLLLLVEFETGFKSYILGQGDNQVCKLILPISQEYEDVDTYINMHQKDITENINKFLSNLQIVSEKSGLHVKLEETWTGMDILVYGKDILHKGAFQPQGLKRISRLLSDVNEVYPTLHTKISTLQTAGSSCAQKSYDVLTPYLLFCIEALMIIIRETRAMFFKRWISKEQCTIVLSSLFKILY
jgi:hypothetical protein